MTRIARALAATGLLLHAVVASSASAATQTLSFPSPGWYFVSIQVVPSDTSPLAVFPTGGGFAYDRLWSYDASDGWRFFSPDPVQSAVLDDLASIVPLRGHWIHVTQVPGGGANLQVTGEMATTMSIEPPSGKAQAWHAIGPLLPSSSLAASVNEVFTDLGPAVATSVLEVWRYDPATDSLLEITDYAADCGTSPDECLAEGAGYWLRVDGTIVIGPAITLAQRGVVVSAGAPLQELRIGYAGAAPLAARLRAEDAAAGVIFLGSRDSLLDDVRYATPDLLVDPAGPATEADFDGDQSPDPCPDACGGLSACVNLCFDGEAEHTVFVGVDLETISTTDVFSSLESGREHTRIVIEFQDEGPPGAGQGAGGASGGPGSVLAAIPLAVKPAVIRGVYAGTLLFENPESGQLPFTLWLDDCVTGVSGNPCGTSRGVGILNATVVGRVDNGIDDDHDGDIDEAGEDRAIRTRTSPGFGPETILLGEFSSDRQRLRLSGSASQLDDLAFAAETCIGTTTKVCSESGRSCSVDADCAGPDAGTARIFASAERKLSIDLTRIGPERFEGSFSDRYENVAAGIGTSSASGRVILERAVAPVCVVPPPLSDPSVGAHVLDIACRGDTDCPGRCDLDPQIEGDTPLEGTACYDDSDCVGIPDGGGSAVTANCFHFSCEFVELAPASDSLAALEHVEATASIDSLDRAAIVQLSGPETIDLLAPLSGGGSLDFGVLSCLGSYTIRIEAPGCDPFETTWDPCPPGSPPSFGPLVCPGPPNVPTSVAAGMSGGAIELRGGPVLIGSDPLTGAALTLHAVGGEQAVAAPTGQGWTHELSWPDVLATLRAGLLEVF